MLTWISPALLFAPSQNTRGTEPGDEKNKEEDLEHPDMRSNLTNLGEGWFMTLGEAISFVHEDAVFY